METSTNFPVTYARIDPELGLINSNVELIKGEIDHLVLCLSPSKSSSWQWDQIFNGLMRQVAKKELKINKVIFISSTRVYDGLCRGEISAKTPVNARSERAQQLITAEQQIEKLASSFHILRCSGLYGAEDQPYQKYREILTRNDNKMRFGVDIEKVANVVVEKLEDQDKVSSYSLLTDGGGHLNGQKLLIEQVNYLSNQYRLLINSKVVF